jgi:4-hydroxybenzoate polyprenyltransferase
MTRLRDLAELVRLPAVLSVPGDTLLGAVAAGAPLAPVRVAGRAAASSCLYLGGMALNDYADRDVDALERPHRPIPSGRVDPAVALRVAQGLTAAGVALAAVTGGLRALRVALPLAASVWSYDLKLKGTPAGPVAMAACRGLDVLLGAAGGEVRRAVLPATVVAGHTLSVTLVSRHEAHGATPDVARRSLWASSAVTAAAALPLPSAGPRGVVRRLAAAAVPGGLLGAYAWSMGRAGARAARDPSPDRLQALVGTGVLALMPLQGALVAATAAGPPPRRRRAALAGAAVGALWPLARHLARRRAVT